MNIKTILIVFLSLNLSLLLSACANTMHHSQQHSYPIQSDKYTLAVNTGSAQHSSQYVPIPMAGQLMSIKNIKSSPQLVGENAILAANKKAIRQPNSGEYINSIMTFDYMAGALYQIYCAPLSVTDVQFQANEHIVSVGAGDTLRWQVSKTFSGNGISRQEHLLIKPVEDGLTNGLVVTTDVRTYHLMLHSTPKTYMASVTWRYPDGDGILQNLGDDSATMSASANLNDIVDLKHLDFNYRIMLVNCKYKPNWYPLLAFNDGKKTYIKFPDYMQDAPTLFVGNSIKNDQLVNYRVSGNYYIVDALFADAQLRSGGKEQVVVQINHR